MALMKSVSGIRGIFGIDLHPINLATFTAAYGEFIGQGAVVVGRDSRVSGQVCEDIVCATLQSKGLDVIKVGIVPTPTVAMAVLKHEAQGGIIISASHNPGQWNALKLLNHKSEFLDAEEGKKVLEIADKTDRITFKDAFNLGQIKTYEDAVSHHIQQIIELPYIDVEQIRKQRFKVGLDAVNGAGSKSIPELLSVLGCEISPIHCEPNGLFPHNPEPLKEHLGDICDLVKNQSLDIGFVVDPDADRLAVVGSDGELWGEEYTQAAAFDFYLAQKEGHIATNLSSSRICDFVASKYERSCYRSAVGEINVVKTMQANNIRLAGEGNGGVINGDLHYGRDALVGIAMILQHLSNLAIDAATYRSTLPNFYMAKHKLQLDTLGIDADTLLLRAQEHYAEKNPITIDGLKLDFKDGWVHLRKSNTEPILRVYTESLSLNEADKLAETTKETLKKLVQ